MPFKRKFKKPLRRVVKKGRKSFTKKRSGVTLQNVAKKLTMMEKTIETKSGVQQITGHHVSP